MVNSTKEVVLVMQVLVTSWAAEGATRWLAATTVAADSKNRSCSSRSRGAETGEVRWWLWWSILVVVVVASSSISTT